MAFCWTRNRCAAAVLLALSVLAVPARPAAAEKRPITDTDIFRFVWIADPEISPDGRQIVFVRVTVSKDREGYDTALWIVPTDGSEPARPFTAGPRDTAPRWSPDGSRLAFVRAAEKDGKTQPGQLYLLSMVGGEPRALTDLPKGAESPAWSPDGRTIAFASTTNDRDLAKQKAKKEGAKRVEGAEEEHESDVRVITKALYRMNGSGYLDPAHPSHLWTLEVPAGAAEAPEPRQLTRGGFREEVPVWSPDGGLIYFTSTRVEEPYYAPQDSDVFAVPAHGGEIRRVASIDGQIAQIAVSRDGKWIAFQGEPTGHPIRSYDQPDLFVVASNPGAAARNLTEKWDYDVGAGVGGDQHAPRGSRPSAVVWSDDGRSVIALTAERGRANLQRFDVASATGGTGSSIEPVTRGDQDVASYSATPDGSRFALVVSTPTTIGDLYVLDAASGQMRPLVRPNEELFAGLDLTPPEEITYASFDGRKIEAWVQKPPDFDPGKKYPLILNIHGGPHAAYGYTFDHEFQWMAAKGYVVLYPNPRGSTSYGQEFGNVIQYRYPGDDYKDLMAGVDELIRRGYVDPKRLGITGGSGGGLLTNWAITQTDRFAAAVAQRSIADWSSFWFTTDFTLFEPRWFRKAPWEDPADFVARSPITHVDRVKTPLLLVEGESDFRTPNGAGGEQMFRALKYLKKPVAMVRFPGETHELSRSGKPWHRVERLRHIVGWFDKYLQGKKVDAFDAP
jgi:dipeptidyl aminopeptidase/acylaminoacyl peptidase